MVDAVQTHDPVEHDTTIEDAEHVQEMLEKVEGVNRQTMIDQSGYLRSLVLLKN